MIKLYKPLIAMGLLLGVMMNPIVAQVQDNQTSNVAQTDTRNDDNTKWGWLGLIGLAGLVGMRRTHKTAPYTSTSTPGNR